MKITPPIDPLAFLPDSITIEGWMVTGKFGGRWKRCSRDREGMKHIVFQTREHAEAVKAIVLANGAEEAEVLKVSGKVDVIDEAAD